MDHCYLPIMGNIISCIATILTKIYLHHAISYAFISLWCDKNILLVWYYMYHNLIINEGQPFFKKGCPVDYGTTTNYV